jgi:hypothetical protein
MSLGITSFFDPQGAKLSGEVPWYFSQKDLIDMGDLFEKVGWGSSNIAAKLKALKPAQKHKLFEVSLTLLRDGKLSAADLKIAMNELLNKIKPGIIASPSLTTPAPAFAPPKPTHDLLGTRPNDTKHGIVRGAPKKQPLKPVPNVTALPILPTYKPVPAVSKLIHAAKGGSLSAPVVKDVELEPLKQDGSRPHIKKQDVKEKQSPRNATGEAGKQTSVKKGNTDNPSKAQMQRKTKQQIDRASTKITELFDTIDNVASRYEEIKERFKQLTAKINNTTFIKNDLNGKIKFNQAEQHSKEAEQLLSDVEKAITLTRESFSKAQLGLTEITQYKQNTNEILVEVRQNISTITTELTTANTKVIRANQRIKWAIETLSKEAARQNR